MFVAVNHISDGLLCSWASCYFYGKIENKLGLCDGLLSLPILPRLGVGTCLLWPFELLVCLEEILNSCLSFLL